MLVIICGMHRSGSTLVAQLVKGLLEAQGTPLTISENGLGSSVEEMLTRAADPDHIWLVKVHQQARRFRDGLPDEGAFYIYTYRDLRDALASAWRKNRLHFGHPQRTAEALQSFIRAQLKAAKVFEARRNLWRGRYENFVHDLSGLTRDLASALNIEATPELIESLVEAARPDEQRRRVLQLTQGDQTVRASSFITSNHITDGREGAWKETLTVAEAELAETLAGDWLKAKGYQLCFRTSEESAVAQAQPDANPKTGLQKRPGLRWWRPFG
jgi:hypothetical protein